MIRTLPLLLLCVACTPEPKTVVKTQFVDRVVESQVALDARLTTPAAKPAIPLFRCRDAAGRPSVCGEDLIDYLQRWQKAGGDSIEQVKAIQALQPKAAK